MNNHLPYRDWIFEEGPLPADSGEALRLHLEQCPECRTIAEGWRGARGSLETAGQKSPREGFASRWKAMAAHRLQSPSPRPAWALLAATSIGSLAMAIVLAVQTSAQGFSMAGVFTRSLSTAAGTLAEWLDTSNSFGAFLSIVSRTIPPACYLLAVFLLCLIGVLWLLLLVRANSTGEKR
jgi:anti-sigma factor RsiW